MKSNHRFLLFLCLSVLASGCLREPDLPTPPVEVKLLGGDGEQSAIDILQIPDGSIWLAGGELRGENYSHDILLIHTNEAGDELNRFYFDEGADEVAQRM